MMPVKSAPDLTVIVQQCLDNQTENGQISCQNGEAFANAVLEFTQVRDFWHTKVYVAKSSLHLRIATLARF